MTTTAMKISPDERDGGSASASSSAPPSRVLLAGDVRANFTTLYDTISKQQQRLGANFDVLFASGSFLEGELSPEAREYLLGTKPPPVATYFVDSHSERFIEGFADGREIGGRAAAPDVAVDGGDTVAEDESPTVQKKLVFLGSHGVKTIPGAKLRVAYLSGHYNEVYYEDDSSSFHGACYTRLAVEQLKRQGKIADEFGQKGIDVLLVSEWPSGWENKVYGELPGSGTVSGATTSSSSSGGTGSVPPARSPSPSPAIADLISALAPRYVVCSGGRELFYQRPPFQTLKAAHVTRMIALAGVKKGPPSASKGEKKWLHALKLRPMAAMDADELKAKPENTTPFPFQFLLANSAGKDQKDVLPGLQRLEHDANAPSSRVGANNKRGREDEEGAEAGGGRELFLTNLPPGLSEKNLRTALERSLGGGALLRLKLMVNEQTGECKGFGFATVVSPEVAEKALSLELEAGGRSVRIERKKPRAVRDPAGADENGTAGAALNKKTYGGTSGAMKKKIVVEPHAECWFCLANPKFQKHMLVAVNPFVYLATAKGGLNDGNLLLCPVKHIPNYLSIFNFTEFEQLEKAFDAHIAAVRKMWLSAAQEQSSSVADVIVWERWIPMKMNHMQIQLLPVPRAKYVNWAQVLDSFAERCGLEFERIGSCVIDKETGRELRSSPGGGGGDLGGGRDEDDVAVSNGFTQLLEKNASRFFANEPERNLQTLLQMPYLYLELPGDSTARGKRMDRYVSYGPGRIPMNFARDMVCAGLGCEEKADWRACQLPGPEEKGLAEKLKQRIKNFL